MQIDYSDTQLDEEDMCELLERRASELANENKQDAQRWAKARSFRFVGGVC